MAGPEKPAQSILSPPGHDMNVKMRHALADPVVHSHKGSVRLQRRFNGARQKLGVLKKRPRQIGRQIEQSLVMSSRNQQAMTGKNGAMVEESDRDFVFKDQSSVHFAGNDLTKQAGDISRAGHVSQGDLRFR